MVLAADDVDAAIKLLYIAVVVVVAAAVASVIVVVWLIILLQIMFAPVNIIVTVALH